LKTISKQGVNEGLELCHLVSSKNVPRGAEREERFELENIR
jgi:hypothetical protein